MKGRSESTAAEKIIKEAVKAKNLEMAYLHMSVEPARTTGCLVKAYNGEYPKGLAHEVWNNFKKVCKY